MSEKNNQSNKKNLNNTGSLWCAKNVKDWERNTHFEYYKNDPQVKAGGILITLLFFVIGLIVCGLIFINSSIEEKMMMLGLSILIVLISLNKNKL